MGTEYARKLEELHREEQLIQEEELEAEALLSNDAPSVATDEVREYLGHGCNHSCLCTCRSRSSSRNSWRLRLCSATIPPLWPLTR